MPRKSNKHSNKKKTRTKRRIQKSKTKKQKPIMMIGCSKCGSKCNCKKQKGGFGTGCGSCGCPMSPLSWDKMNKFGGNSLKGGPVLIDPSKQGNYIPTFGLGQKGGNCTTCPQNLAMKGGNFFKPAAPMPGPISGSAWNTSVKGWPTMNGIGGDRNYLNSYASSITKDPQQQMSMSNSGYKTANSMVGGRHNRRHKKTNKRGGGFIPTDLLNLGRNVNYSINSAYNTFKGYNPPVNHLPYKDQLTGALNKASLI